MSEALSVAIDLKIIDHFSAAMEGVSKQLIAASEHAEELQKKFENIGAKFKAGMAMTSLGSDALKMLKATTDEAVRYEQQLNRLKALKLGDATTKGLEDKAREISNSVKGTSETDALALVTQTQAATGDVEQTKMLAPVLAQMRFGMETYMKSHDGGEGKGDEAQSQFEAVVKLMESRGLMHDMTSEKIDKMADLFTKSFVATGGSVQPTEFLEMMRASGAGAQGMSDDAVLAMGHMIHEKGGAGAGAEVKAAYGKAAQGTGALDKPDAYAAQAQNVMGYKDLYKQGTETVTGQQQDLQVQIDKLEGAFGEAALPLLKTALEQAIPLVKELAEWLKAHPTGLKVLVDGLAAVGLGLMVIGPLMTLSGVFNAVGTAVGLLGGSLGKASSELEFLRMRLSLAGDTTGRVGKLLEGLGKFGGSLKELGGKTMTAAASGLRSLGAGLRALGSAAWSGTLRGLGGMASVLRTLGSGVVSTVTSGLSGMAGQLRMLATTAMNAASGSLSAAAGQLKLLGSAAAVFAAYEAGHWVGTKIYENMSPEHKEEAGGTVATILSWLGSKDAQEAIDATMKANAALSPNEMSRLAFERAKKQAALHDTTQAAVQATAQAVAKAVPKAATHATTPPHAAAPATSEDKHAAEAAAKAAQQKPSVIKNYLTVLLDGKEIAARLIPHASMGTGDFNPSDSKALPGMSNYTFQT